MLNQEFNKMLQKMIIQYYHLLIRIENSRFNINLEKTRNKLHNKIANFLVKNPIYNIDGDILISFEFKDIEIDLDQWDIFPEDNIEFEYNPDFTTARKVVQNIIEQIYFELQNRNRKVSVYHNGFSSTDFIDYAAVKKSVDNWIINNPDKKFIKSSVFHGDSIVTIYYKKGD